MLCLLTLFGSRVLSHSIVFPESRLWGFGEDQSVESHAFAGFLTEFNGAITSSGLVSKARMNRWKCGWRGGKDAELFGYVQGMRVYWTTILMKVYGWTDLAAYLCWCFFLLYFSPSLLLVKGVQSYFYHFRYYIHILYNKFQTFTRVRSSISKWCSRQTNF